jgi:hypothetical protein
LLLLNKLIGFQKIGTHSAFENLCSTICLMSMNSFFAPHRRARLTQVALSALTALSASALALAPTLARADVIHNLSLDFQSCAQFVGTVTFKDDYSSLLDASGTVSAGFYPAFAVGWTWYQGAGPIDSQNEDLLSNTLEDYLMQGPDIDHSNFHQIGISWSVPINGSAPQLAITPATNRSNRSINVFDEITDYSFGAGNFVQSGAIPEPGALALMGLALAGVAIARRRQRV